MLGVIREDLYDMVFKGGVSPLADDLQFGVSVFEEFGNDGPQGPLATEVVLGLDMRAIPLRHTTGTRQCASAGSSAPKEFQGGSLDALWESH
ncbi:hypothetical protein NDU88_006944 [Pleurodeles waltl]|uniref:Uncharacterized protein n=1 Tax=Pleurodeles waltl TaxID=8319 RepID=A0AAV7RTH0_PLEWA|nr:hypothetical protein NDU88_006944 [Pleurodeles waltl]